MTMRQEREGSTEALLLPTADLLQASIGGDDAAALGLVTMECVPFGEYLEDAFPFARPEAARKPAKDDDAEETDADKEEDADDEEDEDEDDADADDDEEDEEDDFDDDDEDEDEEDDDFDDDDDDDDDDDEFEADDE